MGARPLPSTFQNSFFTSISDGNVETTPQGAIPGGIVDAEPQHPLGVAGLLEEPLVQLMEAIQ